jgi:hypothetical protein
VNLLWDPTLLRGSTPKELDELVNALQAARSRFHNGPPHLFRAFVRSSDRMSAPQLQQQFAAWGDAGLVQDLPKDYESTKRDSGVPVIRDAVKVGLSLSMRLLIGVLRVVDQREVIGRRCLCDIHTGADLAACSHHA